MPFHSIIMVYTSISYIQFIFLSKQSHIQIQLILKSIYLPLPIHRIFIYFRLSRTTNLFYAIRRYSLNRISILDFIHIQLIPTHFILSYIPFLVYSPTIHLHFISSPHWFHFKTISLSLTTFNAYINNHFPN